MHSPLQFIRVAVIGCACAAYGSVAHADTVLYSQDFNTPNSATPLSSFSWSEFRGGSPSTPSLNGSGTSTGEIFDVQRVAFMNINTTNATTSWFAGLRHTFGSSLPTTDLSLLSLSANVYAGGSVGPRGDVTLRIESSANNWIGWTVTGATLTETNGIVAGGLLSTATHSAGAFNPSATSFNIVLAYANTIGSWGNDSSNIIGIDNVLLQQVSVIPEPSSAAALLGLVALCGVALRRRRG